jgi:hypothetical protein
MEPQFCRSQGDSAGTYQYHLASSEHQAGKAIGQRIHLPLVKLVAGVTHNAGAHFDHNPAGVHQK